MTQSEEMLKQSLIVALQSLQQQEREVARLRVRLEAVSLYLSSEFPHAHSFLAETIANLERQQAPSEPQSRQTIDEVLRLIQRS